MIDLHMHSAYSDDSEFTPAQLVAQCAAAGVTLMSITDHNCVKANAQGALEAQKVDIQYIPGVEIDCVLDGVNFHVLGYGIDSSSPDFMQIEKNVHDQEAEASRARVAALRAFGFDIDEQDLPPLKNGVSWTGECIAQVLLAKDETDPKLAPYRPGGDRSDNPLVNFYWDYCSQGKPGYVPIHYPSMAATIEVIHKAGGKAVLAHPAQNLQGHKELFAKALDLGMDGVEAFSSYHSEEQADFFAQQAQQRGLIVTCGSDYHGKTKPKVKIGSHGADESRIDLQALAGMHADQ